MNIIALILGILIDFRCVGSNTGVIDISDPKSLELFFGPTKIGNAHFYKYTCKENGSYSNIFDGSFKIFPLRSHTRLTNVVLGRKDDKVELVQVMYYDVKKDLRLNNLYYRKLNEDWELVDAAEYKSELLKLKNNYVSFHLTQEDHEGFKKVKSSEVDGYDSYVLEDEFEIDKIYENKLVVWESDPNYAFKSVDLAKTEEGEEQLRIKFSNYCSEVSQYYKISGGRWVLDISNTVVDLRSLYTHGSERNKKEALSPPPGGRPPISIIVEDPAASEDEDFDSGVNSNNVENNTDTNSTDTNDSEKKSKKNKKDKDKDKEKSDENKLKLASYFNVDEDEFEYEDEELSFPASDLCDVDKGFGDITFNMVFTKEGPHELTIRSYSTYEILNFEFINLKGAKVTSIVDGDSFLHSALEDDTKFFNGKLSYVLDHDVATVALTVLKREKGALDPDKKQCTEIPYDYTHAFHKKEGKEWSCLEKFPYYYEMNNLIEVASQLTMKRMYESPPETPTHTPSALYLDYGGNEPFTYEINNPFENRITQELIYSEPDFIRLRVKKGHIMNAIVDGSSVLWEQKEMGLGVIMIYIYKSEDNLVGHLLVDSKTEPHIFIKQRHGRWHLIDREEYEESKDVPLRPRETGVFWKKKEVIPPLDEYSFDPEGRPAEQAEGSAGDGKDKVDAEAEGDQLNDNLVDSEGRSDGSGDSVERDGGSDSVDVSDSPVNTDEF